MTKSKIEWTERVWNPTTGCSKVSQGCKNCYAEVMHKRLMKIVPDKYAKPFLYGAVSHLDTLTIPSKWKKPSLIFVNSMSDLFHEDISFEFIAAVFSVMSDIDRHTYQVLTKRPERMVEFYQWQAARLGAEWIPSNNVWIGVSVEDQETFEKRIVELMQCGAAVRFLSCEPLLGNIDLRKHFDCGGGYAPLAKYLDWIIIGGESGHNARPLHPQIVRALTHQCNEYNIPVYFKQWGDWMPLNRPLVSAEIALLNGKGKSLHADGMHYLKVGKKKAGRTLDGQEYNEFPRAYKGGQ